jgi:hypothetical protein
MEGGKGGIAILMSPSKMVDKMKPPGGGGRREEYGEGEDEDREMQDMAYGDAWATFWAGVKSGDEEKAKRGFHEAISLCK